jgi:hypothetical protein
MKDRILASVIGCFIGIIGFVLMKIFLNIDINITNLPLFLREHYMGGFLGALLGAIYPRFFLRLGKFF